MEDKDFIGKAFVQKCGISLFVLEKTELKQSGRNPLYLCQFEDGQKILCRKDHVLRGTVQNKNKIEEHEKEFLFKEWKQNEGHIIIPIRKTSKQISGIYCYEGYIKGYEKEGLITFLKSYAQRGTVSNPFLVWRNKEKFLEYLKEIQFEPTIENIAQDLKLSVSRVGQIIYKYEAFNYIKYNHVISGEEKELSNYIGTIYNGRIEKYILKDSKEIDIYLPDLKLGFEFNGNYWHCEINKEKDYHKNKSLEAKEEGIRLIHIWEYEWLQNKEKIKGFIKSLLNKDKSFIEARYCTVKEISMSEYNDFCRKYNLEGECAAQIQLGLFFEGNLIQILSLEAPNFTNKYDWRILRECSRFDDYIIGGKEKLWAYFVKHYNPKNCISYCDFSKFDGHSYLKLGFKFLKLKPDFVWWEEGDNIIYKRNSCPNNSHNPKNRCLKIWKAGQMVFEWTNN